MSRAFHRCRCRFSSSSGPPQVTKSELEIPWHIVIPVGLTLLVVGKDAFPSEPKKKAEQNSDEDEIEKRLKQELQQTSFKEWKSAGFDPEATSTSKR